MPRKRQQREQIDPATAAFNAGYAALQAHPLFALLALHANVVRQAQNACPSEGWAVVTSNGVIHAHPTRRLEPEEWTYVLAHCLLHLGFGHAVAHPQPRVWNAACDLFVDRFLLPLKLGRPPAGFLLPYELSGSEQAVAEQLAQQALPQGYVGDMIVEPVRRSAWAKPADWPQLLGHGLSAAVTSAVEVAGGATAQLGASSRLTSAQKARRWFINSYPLLGALAAAFTLVEDARVCIQLGVGVAAVDMQRREIYLNPAAGLGVEECRFVIAHELLHVGLRHDVRCQGRDHFLWNVACDYVINGWLVELGVGVMPAVGGLYDPSLKGESAEAIYDRIVTDMRRFRRLATLRGIGLGDMLEGPPGWWVLGEGADLDAFYRQCLAQGLEYHQGSGRGFLPGDMVQEIRALSQPPIPWDVALARWFEHYFAPLEPRRSYAHPSRRQSATPDIPRPRYVPHENALDARTFGVVLDTSGSMNAELLGKALGAIASYSIAHDVPAVRVVFCDAAAYDAGYMPPEAIAGRVQVRGRGGTILQPGIDLLEQARDFPSDGPLLVITDGQCDRLLSRRPHAFLLPQGRHLPFVPRGPVFFLA